ncbi:MAG: DUF4956 domain-containing protein [Candidatus Fimivivens sp.]|nr:DUF4956 domain-containing protein [Candidatus Fimivivens sp.]
MLESIITSTSTGVFTLQSLMACTIASIILGIGVAVVYMYKNEYNRNFVITLALLPAMVQVVISLVNGNLGTGVAVLGAFSLVRFRSVPGSAREISSIFFAMAIGLATAMGYILYAFAFLLIIGAMTILLTLIRFGDSRSKEKDLRITIPEDLDYTGIFDDLFAAYTRRAELLRVKTTNMGSLYELRYRIVLKDENTEKQLLDKLRCRNGNLTILCGRVATGKEEL